MCYFEVKLVATVYYCGKNFYRVKLIRWLTPATIKMGWACNLVTFFKVVIFKTNILNGPYSKPIRRWTQNCPQFIANSFWTPKSQSACNYSEVV